MKERRYCAECRDFVPYTIKPAKLSDTLNDKVYEYDGVQAICSLCGNEIFVPEVNDTNLDMLYEVAAQNK